jgi:hypothetical protein
LAALHDLPEPADAPLPATPVFHRHPESARRQA